MRFAVLMSLAACAAPPDYVSRPAATSEVQDWRDEIIYQVMIDRFANGDRNNDFNVTKDPRALARYQGGDWQGLIDQLDYLTDLGVTALWISPVIGNVEEDAGVAGYHGYWTQDFVATNPHFGDLPKLRELVDVAHQRGVKVIVDIVTNHVGQLFYYDINRNGQPDTTIYGAGDQDSLDGFSLDPIEVVTEWDPSYDPRGIQGWTSLGESGPAPLGWVYMPQINRVPPNPPEFANPEWYNRRGRVYDWNQRDQVIYGDFPGGLKDLNTANPEVVDALIDVFKYWITETNIDGYRIDTVKHIEHAFWQQFCPSIRQHCKDLGKERFLMFGEVFDGDDELLGSYTFDEELDSVFYFSHKFQVFDDVFRNGQPTKKIEELYQQRLQHFDGTPHTDGIGVAPQQALVNFIDNHDIPRFLWNIDDPRRLGAALTYLLTIDGIPCIYYGTEQGFAGGNDPANREVLWGTGYDREAPFFQQIAALSRVRRTYEVMRRGGFSIKWASDRGAGEEDAGIIAYERPLDDRSALVVVNSGPASSHTSYQGNDMPVTFAPGTVLQAVYPRDADTTYTVSPGGTVRVELGPFEGVVLVPQGDVLPLVE
ncbi:MAG TPA: alpha-amylase family glycosyl hydrolase [Myxococcota bacterium]|nr:alpha-amylase family glycosyl hydrolase [Myxococcota bacterium]